MGCGHAGGTRAWRLQGCLGTGTATGTVLPFHSGSLKKARKVTQTTLSPFTLPRQSLRAFSERINNLRDLHTELYK